MPPRGNKLGERGLSPGLALARAVCGAAAHCDALGWNELGPVLR